MTTRRSRVIGAVVGLMSMAWVSIANAAPVHEPGPNELQMAWLDDTGGFHSVTLDADGQIKSATPAAAVVGADDQIPLGSLWKLVAYARLADNQASETAYTCRGHDPEEVYCCGAGQRIDRATALWRSCSLYFAPRRIGFDDLPEGDTLAALPVAMAPLHSGANLRSDTRVPLSDWLSWLAAWPAATRGRASDDLLGYWLQGPGQASLASAGSRLRIKTFTVERTDLGAEGQRWSGASGWTDDGTPFWMAARGTSAQVVPQWAARVIAVLDAQRDVAAPLSAQALAGPCVEVEFFSRYPIRRINPSINYAPKRARPDVAAAVSGSSAPSTTAALMPARSYTIDFANGQQLTIESRRDLTQHTDVSGGVTITGRFMLDEYVARVIDREGNGQATAAARALAVAARTYVLAHGESRNGCLVIADSSATQRVAPRPASRASLAAARFTSGLILKGVVGQYRTREASDNVMSWQASVDAASAGTGFDAILKTAYPQAALASMIGDGASSCEPLHEAADWLRVQRNRWHRTLLGEPGYRSPGAVQVCRLLAGRPYAVRDTDRLYVSGVGSLEQRIALTHEFLHLAFSGHPRGSDEDFVEQRARRLLGV